MVILGYIHRKKAIVLVSGGMDSALTAAYALRKYNSAFLHINYGQRTEKRELKAFNDISDYYGIAERLVIDFKHLKIIGGSSLTDRKIKVSKGNLASQDIPSSYVPFRNANILAAAVSWAEVIGAEKVFIGAVEEDSSHYPDCRKKFFEAFKIMIKLGVRPDTDIGIETPVINFSKKDIVKKSIAMGVPLHLSWSCYKSSIVACGECDSCLIRQRGFQEAGYQDPIKYKKNFLFL